MDDTKLPPRVARALHDAHLRYQRQAMRPDRCDIAPDEVRGLRYKPRQRTLAQQLEQVRLMQSAFTGIRPNFWKSYIETLLYMSR